MASIVFTAVGYMAGGPLGAQIGGFIGSFIDQALFAPPAAKGPRLNDLNVQASTYGNPIPRVYGAENRLAGNLIWSTGLIETEVAGQGGKGGGGAADGVTYKYHVDCAFGLCRGVPGGIVGVRRIWADGKLFMDEDGVQKHAEAVRVYLGTEDQLPDPTIEAAVGAGATPAYRGMVYVVFERLELADYGNRIPNFTFEVVAHNSATVATVIDDLCEAAGVPYLDAARTDYLDLRGFMIGRPATIRDSLTPLRGAYFFDMSEIEGELQFFPVDGTPVAKVAPGDLGAHPFGTDRPAGYDARRISGEELPRQITVQHMDPARDYQVNSQRSRRATVSSDSDLSVDLPIVMTASEGKAIAERMHYMAWLRRTKLSAQLPIDYLHVEAGQKIIIPCDDGRDRAFRVIRKETRLPGSIAVECETDAASVLSRVAVATPAPVPPQEVKLPGVTVAHLMDLPILRDEDDSSGFYVAGNGASSGWRGAVLYRSLDGLNYTTLVDLPTGAFIGATENALGEAAPHYLDNANGVTVALLDAAQTLESVSDAQVLNGANACVIGDEVMQFGLAELIGPARYRLSRLLRGRKGTEDKIAGHAAGDRFILLSGAAGIYRPAIAAAELGVERQYKAASNGTLVSDAVAQAFTHTGRWAKPYAVAHVRGVRNAGGDLAISWIRRTRLDAPWLDGVDAPLGEDSEAYEIDVLDGGGATVRTISATTPAATYAAADQVADFGAAQPAVTLRIYQMSSRVGRGLPKEATL